MVYFVVKSMSMARMALMSPDDPFWEVVSQLSVVPHEKKTSKYAPSFRHKAPAEIPMVVTIRIKYGNMMKINSDFLTLIVTQPMTLFTG